MSFSITKFKDETTKPFPDVSDIYGTLIDLMFYQCLPFNKSSLYQPHLKHWRA